ncbi:flagellar biosynthesis protein FlhB [Pseudohongiella sp.]|uniref:Flagellar biosynthetic protein FlhB n=1 Tax=marine sediment metagenome TaxID=412755 RepID=A0A0F9W0A1_9ZZZZ|nr:flagellar biosynthesis protein FlhB [Pseudohongiella sp.]HDZ09936.1 flagellar biosynthesis protein FlhB [Pseudohongiella sp.]HEA64408.1 flagellar biosynthesis protein FlhB [Pseudohongiella sp.]
MAEQDSSSEKTQEPTAKRLEKAREDGDTVRSKELNTMAILIAGSAALLMFGGFMIQALAGLMSHNFVLEREQVFDTSAMLSHLDVSAMQGLRSLLPVFGVLLVAAILGPIGLGGWNVSMKAVMPKANRMNPMSGLGRMFGPKAFIELAKAAGKVVVVAAIALVIMAFYREQILSIMTEPLLPAMRHTLIILGWSVLAMSCAMILITIVDIPFQIHSHTEKLKMTFQEVKDEMKDTEGKPEVKQKIRQLQYQMTQNRMLSNLPEADVIVTNPQHYAVALKYQQGGSAAPVMIGKGIDFMALRIREVAKEHDIPIVESPVLARAIYYNTDLDEEIPEGLYKAVAQVLAYVFQLRQYRHKGGRRPVLADNLPVPDDLQHD